MTPTPIDSPPRVLIVGAAAHAEGIVDQLAHHLKRHRDYALSALMPQQSGGRPLEKSRGQFERIESFPQPGTRHKGLSARLALLRDLLAPTPAAARSGVDPAPSDSASSLDRIRWRLWRKLQYREFARHLPPLFSNQDVVLWQTLSPLLAPVLQLVPPRVPVAISIWGSDLLRTSGVEAYRCQLAACRRATRITVCSLEMREIFLAKFGRSFADKMRVVRFGSDLFAKIDDHRDEREEFRGRLGLAADRLMVCIGHNGSAANRHVEVLRSLSRLPASRLERLQLVLPMTYGTDPVYLGDVRRSIEELGLPVQVLEKPLPLDDVARLRASTDVLIHVPLSDAFSSAMTETIYGGGVLITGGWLPYGTLRRSGIHYHEIDCVDQVADKLADVVDDFAAQKDRAESTAAHVRSLADWECVVEGWTRLCDELIEQTAERST